jgi:hypothetical protein
MDLKSKFLDLLRMALIDFSFNHPGNMKSAKILESAYKISEESLEQAMIAHKNTLSAAVEEYIKYVFTGGKNRYYQRPAWLPEKEDSIPTR